MIPELAELVERLQVEFAFAAIIFFRIGAACAVIPVFGERSIPPRVRIVVALAFTVLVQQISFPEPRAEIPSGSIFAVLFSETAIGLALGISVRLIVHGLQVAGTIAAQSTSLSQILGNTAVDPQPAIGHVLLIAGLALLATFGLHIRLVEYFHYSYQLFPVGSLPDPAELAQAGVKQIADGFRLGFAIAAPFVIASSVYNIALGAINRAMPQLMVSFVGAPAITAAGMIILAAVAPLMLAVWAAAFFGFLQSPFGP